MLKKGNDIVVLLLVWISTSLSGQQMESLFSIGEVLKGWNQEGETVYYTSDNLFDYINGEAELYHAYGFQELAVQTYYHGSPEDTFITINIYDMGSLSNSFGVYSSYRVPGYRTTRIGGEAILIESGLKFFQDRFFVDIYISFDREEFMLQVAEAVSKEIGGSLEGPEMIQLLPEGDQIKNTLHYKTSDMLNHAFLPQGVEAQYQMDGQEVTGFIVIFEGEKEAGLGLKALKEYHIGTGDELIETPFLHDKGFAVHAPYQGIVIVEHYGSYLIGGRGFETVESGLRMVKKIEGNLKEQ